MPLRDCVLLGKCAAVSEFYSCRHIPIVKAVLILLPYPPASKPLHGHRNASSQGLRFSSKVQSFQALPPEDWDVLQGLAKGFKGQVSANSRHPPLQVFALHFHFCCVSYARFFSGQ